jgi:tetratricopeptide (TPR) repeat protein
LEKNDDAPFYGKRILDIAKKTGDEQTAMYAHLILGQTYATLYHLSSFSFHANEGMNLAEKLKDDNAKKKFTELLFKFYLFVGMHEKANTYNTPLYKELHDVPTSPEQDLVDALEQAKKTNDVTRHSMALFRLCKYYDHKHQYEKGIQCLKQFMDLQLGNNYMNLYCYTSIVKSYVSMKQYDKALHYCQGGLAVAKECSDTFGQSSFYCLIGKLYFITHQFKFAEEYLREEIRCFETVFGSLGNHDIFKISFVDKYIDCYKSLSLVLIQTNQIKEALLVSDRCRARALKDLLITNYGMKQEASDDEQIKYTDIEDLVSNNKYAILFYFVFHDELHTFLVDGGNKLQYSVEDLRTCKIDIL